MISVPEILDAARRCISGKLSLAEFEDWFSVRSWNVHQQKNPAIEDLVFGVEAVFSKYHFDDLGDEGFREELGKVIDPFEAHAIFLIRTPDDDNVHLETAGSGIVLRKPMLSQSGTFIIPVRQSFQPA